ncbi:hypothetical protein [Xylophilus sp.]|uniref:hypothetical protein n=1 Tax=Xylophilus sp. TaxID=2653893 RepID=UPI002D7E2D6E|nr:hypothetical protein [Xylophilus sp.]
MAKRNWPGHPGIGKQLEAHGELVTVVDVKCGPMLIDTSTFDKPSADISGTLILRIKRVDGTERWLPPIDADSFLAWCAKQDAKIAAAREVPNA